MKDDYISYSMDMTPTTGTKLKRPEIGTRLEKITIEVFYCKKCGALVMNTEIHDMLHNVIRILTKKGLQE